jgi:hypothetical protein
VSCLEAFERGYVGAA